MDLENEIFGEKKNLFSKQKQARKELPVLSLQAEKRAHKIVMKCIDSTYSYEILAQLFKYIKPEHFDDICKERALSGLCGYPTCNNEYEDTFGDNTFIIRHNNVYNIEKRRHFCSNKCYQASAIVFKQIPLTPLYLRDEESEASNIELPDPSELKGTFGELVNIAGVTLSDEQMHDKKFHKERNEHTTIDDIARESLVMCTENSNSKKGSTSEGENIKNIKNKSSVKIKDNKSRQAKVNKDTGPKVREKKNMDGDKLVEELSNLKIDCDDNLQENNIPDEHRCFPDTEVKDDKYRADVMSKINDLMIRDRGGKKHENQSSDSVLIKEREQDIQNKSNSLDLIYQVEKTLREWMTFDSLREILGDKYVRGMLEHIHEDWDNYDTTNDLHLSSNARLKYITLCRQLDAEEREEERLEEAELEINMENDDDEEILPDYKQLQKDVELQSMKVKAFLAGEMEYLVDGSNDHSNVNNSCKDNKLKVVERNTSTEETTSSLPLIDEYSQRAWRQQIVMEKIDNVLCDLVLLFNLSEKEVRHIVLKLVSTFELSRDNIFLKPIQWIVVVLAIIKMLSIRYPAITKSLNEESSISYVSSILKGFELDLQYLERLIAYLTEISYILEKVKKSKPEDDDASEELTEMSNKDEELLPTEEINKSSTLEELD